jgi:hypothetical protein
MPLLRRSRQLSVRFLRNWILPFSFVVLAQHVHGQATGRLSGTVQDGGGKAVAGARVTLRPAASSVVYSSTISNRAGGFFFGVAGAGAYDLVVEATSFSRQTLKGVQIDPAVETSLQPIRLASQPAVKAKAPESNLQTASVDTSFPVGQELRRLPLPGRNPLSLISTLPGVQENGRAASIDGQSPATANIDYDGVNVAQSVIGTNALGPLSLPLRADQVEEATLVTGAIYGCGCTQVAFTSQSGTNALHGSAYWLTVPTGVTAQYWADNSRRTPVTTNLNQLGATAGGALNRDRLLFFLNYEADLDRSRLTRTGSVPTQPLTSQDPQVQRVLALIPSDPSGSYRGEQENGYTTNLGTARLDYLASARNTFGATFAYTKSSQDDPADSSVFGSKPTTTVHVSAPFYSTFWRWSLTARLTNEVRAGASLPSIEFANALRSKFNFVVNLNDPNVSVSQPMMGTDPTGREDYLRSYQDNLTAMLGKHMVQAGAWIQQYRLNTYGNNDGLLDSLTVPRYVVNNIAQGTISEVDQRFNITSPTSGYSGGSTARSRLSANMLSGYFHDNWKLFGSLMISMGLRYDYLSPAVEHTGTAIVPIVTGSIADSVYFQNLNFAYASKQQPLYVGAFDHYSPYFGLAWKPVGKFPLVVRGSTGVSYIPDELVPDIGIYALRNPFQSFNVSTDLAQRVRLANAPTTATPLLPATLTLQSLLSFANSYHQEPGTVYAIDPELRTPNVHAWNLGIEAEVKGYQFGVRYVGNRLDEAPRSVDRNQVMLPAAFFSAFQQVRSQLLSGQSTNGFALLPGGGICVNFSLQNCQPDRYAISLIKTGQVGELARWYQGQGYLNGTAYYVLGNPLAPQGIDLLSKLGHARYDALQLTASRRLSQGLGLTASYVLSKVMSSLDDYQPGAIDPYLNVHNSTLEWAPAPFNLTNALKATAIWDLPLAAGTGVVRRVLSHWSVSGILMAQSGAPFSLVSGGYVVEPNGTVSEVSGLGTFTSIADSGQNSVFTTLTGGQIQQFFGIHENPNGTVSYVNAPNGAFQEPAPGTIGNLQKRLFRGPGAFNLNLGVRKVISLNERSQAEFRAESINLLNNVNWLVGDQAYLGNNGQGAVFNNSVAQWNLPRTFQFSLRVMF